MGHLGRRARSLVALWSWMHGQLDMHWSFGVFSPCQEESASVGEREGSTWILPCSSRASALCPAGLVFQSTSSRWSKWMIFIFSEFHKRKMLFWYGHQCPGVWASRVDSLLRHHPACQCRSGSLDLRIFVVFIAASIVHYHCGSVWGESCPCLLFVRSAWWNSVGGRILMCFLQIQIANLKFNQDSNASLWARTSKSSPWPTTWNRHGTLWIGNRWSNGYPIASLRKINKGWPWSEIKLFLVCVH